MTLEEINKWLNNEYGVSYTKLEELHDFYFEKYCDLEKENQELKKQLEEYDRKLFITKTELDMRQKSIDNKLNQQKEFIEYLRNLSNWYSADGVKQGMVNDILSKYKEIIGNKE